MAGHRTRYAAATLPEDGVEAEGDVKARDVTADGDVSAEAGTALRS
ncbi:hypothetical protein AB0G79_32770 [Streptomyces sp. NPDC020807]